MSGNQEKLTDNAYWNSIYNPRVGTETVQKTSVKGRLRAAIGKMLGRKITALFDSYPEYQQWEYYFKTYLPETKGLKILEVGSAPGHFLVELCNRFGFVPYGVEYTEDGATINKAVYSQAGYDPENVIHADFFSAEFQEKYKGYFDIVISRGFIEHFTDVKAVVDQHVDLLKPDGRLIITIPRLVGFNYWIGMFLHKENVAIHNLTIMKKSVYEDLFDTNKLNTLLCKYFGTFDFQLFNTKPGSFKRHILSVFRIIQKFLNFIFRMLLGKRGLESAFFSPYLIYIGDKK